MTLKFNRATPGIDTPVDSTILDEQKIGETSTGKAAVWSLIDAAQTTRTRLFQMVDTGVFIAATGMTISAFGTAGVLHNNASGQFSSSLIVNADIAAGTIAGSRLATGAANTVMWSDGATNAFVGNPILSTSLQIGTGATSFTFKQYQAISGAMAVYAGVTPAGSAQGATNYSFYANSDSGVTSTAQVNAPDAAGFVAIGTGSFTRVQIAAGEVRLNKTQAYKLVHLPQTTDTASFDFTIESQAAFGTNHAPGNLIFNTPAPTGTGSPGFHKFQSRGVTQIQLGEYLGASSFAAIHFGSATPSLSNWNVSSDGTVLAFNTTSDVGYAFSMGLEQHIAFSRVGGANIVLFGTNASTNGIPAAIRMAARTTDTPTADITIQGMAPFSGASLANGKPGNVIVNIPAAVASAAEGFFKVSIAGANKFHFGKNNSSGGNWSSFWVGSGITPIDTNYTLTSDGSSGTFLNGPSADGFVGFGANNSPIAYFTKTATITGVLGLTFETGTAYTIGQRRPSGDNPALDITLSSQAPSLTSTTNNNSANVIINTPAARPGGVVGNLKVLIGAAALALFGPSGVRIGDNAIPTHMLEVASGTVQIVPFNVAGVVHNNASGVLSSSLIVDSDITGGTISTGKIAPGTNGQILTTSAGVATWVTASGVVTLAGDVTGSSAATVVERLTGLTGTVSILTATKLAWLSSGPSLEYNAGDLSLKVNTANKNIRLDDNANLIGVFNWNGSNPYFQVGSGAAQFQLLANAGTNQAFRILVAGTTPIGLQLDADNIFFRTAAAANKAKLTNTGFRVGDGTDPVERLEVVGTGRFTTLGVGIGHLSSTGVLSSSLLLDVDVAPGAAIAVTKLALGGTNQVLWSNGSANSWTGAPILSTSLSIGTTPATVGAVRLANNSSISARNAANSVDIGLIAIDTSNRVVIGSSAAAVHVATLGLGVVHSSSSGLLSSSTVTDADILFGAISVSKLAAGTSGQFLVTNATPQAAWVTAAGDWVGAVDANQVIGLTGTTSFGVVTHAGGVNGAAITTARTELIYEQTGDALGGSRLRLQNRSGVNGAMLQNISLDLVDFVFKGTTGIANIRQESRVGQMRTGGTEFQFGVPGSPSIVIGSASNAMWFADVGAPTSNPTGGVYLYGNSGTLRTRSPNGLRTTISGEIPSSTNATYSHLVYGKLHTATTGTALTFDIPAFIGAVTYSYTVIVKITALDVAGDLVSTIVITTGGFGFSFGGAAQTGTSNTINLSGGTTSATTAINGSGVFTVTVNRISGGTHEFMVEADFLIYTHADV